MGTISHMRDYTEVDGDFPLANTKAARMFREGLAAADRDQNLSQRAIGRLLGYKTAVVLSHMASGRTPIPVERVPDYARILRIDQAEFLLAVLEQRYPLIQFQRLLLGNKGKLAGKTAPSADLIADLEASAGIPLENLNSNQVRIMKEMLADSNPQRRFVSINEAVVIEEIRKVRPEVTDRGISVDDRRKITEALS